LKRKIKVLEINEANKQMDLVLNAVKGLRQDLYQNAFCAGQEAYKEVMRMLFLKMIEDKKVSEGEMDEKYHILNRKNLREKLEKEREMSVHRNWTENEVLNDIFVEDIIKGNGEYEKYKNLFYVDERIISTPDMIYKFISKIEKVNFIDLMDNGKDIIGIVFEQFANEVQNPEAGQIFTPPDIVDFMVSIAKVTFDDIACDFCSGSGRFITTAMRSMVQPLIEEKERIEEKANLSKNDKEKLQEIETKIENIMTKQIYGADIGADPTLNTKRNLALAGDGSSNIANMNSLFIEVKDVDNKHISIFKNGIGVNEEKLVGIIPDFEAVDISLILTNPPFGDLSLSYPKYSKEWIDEMRETFNKASWSELKRWIPRYKYVFDSVWEYDSEELIDKLEDLIDRAPMDRGSKKIESIIEKLEDEIRCGNRHVYDSELFKELMKEGRRKVSTCVKTKKGEEVIDGQKDFKGCLMFLYKAYQMLKIGGRVLIVVDDGILNTDTYSFARDFIRNKFFIKGIFSLTDKAFYAYSDKTIKTSILYLEKKAETIDEDGDIYTELQIEPTFYAQAEKIGVNSKRGKYENHLPLIKNAYFNFVKEIEENKNNNNGIFNYEKFVFKEGQISGEDE
jgi:hypothetical protein